MDDSQATRPSLLLRIRDPKDTQAWSQFVDVYSPLLFGLFRRRGLQEADAADVTQEVFRTVARSIKRFKGGSGRASFRSWLIAVARSRLSDFLASRSRQVSGSGDTEVLDMLAQLPSDNDEERIFEQEYRERSLQWAAEQVRGHFEDSTWQAFWQTNVEGKATQEVAAALGMSVGAVYIARSRVLARIKSQIQQLEE